MELSEALQEQILEGVRGGATVVDLLRLIREECGLNGPGQGRLAAASYLTRTLGIPLTVAVEVGGWVGFGDDDGLYTDTEIDAKLGSYLESFRESHVPSAPSTDGHMK